MRKYQCLTHSLKEYWKYEGKSPLFFKIHVARKEYASFTFRLISFPTARDVPFLSYVFNDPIIDGRIILK